MPEESTEEPLSKEEAARRLFLPNVEPERSTLSDADCERYFTPLNARYGLLVKHLQESDSELFWQFYGEMSQRVAALTRAYHGKRIVAAGIGGSYRTGDEHRTEAGRGKEGTSGYHMLDAPDDRPDLSIKKLIEEWEAKLGAEKS